MPRQTLQTSLFPDTPRTAYKPEPSPLEKALMVDVQRYAASLGLPSVHIENYCGNSFNVVCPCCGHKELVTCRHTINKVLRGYPDVIGMSWGIECKRDGLEPSPLQLAVHDQLRRAGIPCLVASPGNLPAAIEFLKTISAKGIKA